MEVIKKYLKNSPVLSANTSIFQEDYNLIYNRALSQLYINFLRLRWVNGGDQKLYGYVAVNEKDFRRFEVSESSDKFERINQNWEELEKCLQ